MVVLEWVRSSPMQGKAACFNLNLATVVENLSDSIIRFPRNRSSSIILWIEYRTVVSEATSLYPAATPYTIKTSFHVDEDRLAWG